MREGIVLIPAYQPDEKLIQLLQELRGLDFKVLVVDDGSGKDYASVFADAAQYAEILSYEENKGKGYALKAGIAHISENYRDFSYFITADADGQHLASDILRVSRKLEKKHPFVLTTRVRKGNIPFRSWIGNALSRFVFTMMTGKYFTDNQSGLRGFRLDQCDWLLKVAGDRYDYEMNVLFFTQKQRIPVLTLDIDAIYIDGNKSSHFNPVQDTLKIYKQLFYSARGSLLSMALVQMLLLISSIYSDLRYLLLTLPTIGIVSVTFNLLFCFLCSMRGFTFRDAPRMLTMTAVRYSLYILFSLPVAMWLPRLPIIVSFNCIMLLMVIPEYWLTKAVSLICLNKQKGAVSK